MNLVNDIWHWIESIERDFVNKNIPFSDTHVKILIRKLRMVEPYLVEKNPGNDVFEHFADKMELKFIREPFHQRFMLVDFVKHIIHENLIKMGDKD